MSEDLTPLTVDPRYIEHLKAQIEERKWSVEGRNAKKPIIWTAAMVALGFLGGGFYVVPAIWISWRMYMQGIAWGESGQAVTEVSMLERLMLHPTANIVDRGSKNV